jgi:FkbH-like protein
MSTRTVDTPVASPVEDAERRWRTALRDWNSRDYSSLVRLSRRLRTLAADEAIGRRLLPVRIAVVSSATIDFLLPVLDLAMLAVNMRATWEVAPYGQVSTSLLDPQSTIASFQPQVTLVMNATPHLPGWPALGATKEEAEALAGDVCRSLIDPCVTFHDRTGSDVVINNFHPMAGRAAGNLGGRLPGDATQFVRRVNLMLGDRVPQGLHIHDVAAMVERRGFDVWFDERYWHLAKQPVSFECVADYCHSLAAVVGAILGRARKALVLDLDNTLWGGVVGDDGLAGIQIGEGSAEGEAFKTFQQYLRALKDRGVLLTVCSKNDDAVARTAFADHPEMVLRQDDFVAFKANWQPKSENIRAIAAELDLPLDAFVFIDDNPAERDEVRQAVPEVTVLEWPDDPGAFVRALEGARLFEAAALTAEDTHRTVAYQARRQAAQAQGAATDVGAYLASLEMVATVRPFEPVSIERITQLVNKTNQFNLTTRRVVQAEIERLSGERSILTRTVRLRDRFADHGLISVLVGRVEDREMVLDIWLMSCRVLGRGVERVLLNDLLGAARGMGVEVITGLYRSSGRNQLVMGHYPGLGFSRAAATDADGPETERWHLRVAEASGFDTFIATES